MNEIFRNYVNRAKSIARSNEIEWRTPTDERGEILEEFIWNVSKMAGDGAPRRIRLKNLGPDKKAFKLINTGEEFMAPLALPWTDLIKSIIILNVYVDRIKPQSILESKVRPLRVVATMTGNKAPWEVTTSDIQNVVDVLKRANQSAKLVDNIICITRTIFDQNRISNFSPVTPSVVDKIRHNGRSPAVIRQHLTERKSSEKLSTAE